jgi:hypothetical protein
MSALSISIQDLKTHQSSLEDIVVGLLHPQLNHP